MSSAPEPSVLTSILITLSQDTCHVPGNQLGPSLLFKDGETEAQAVQSQFESRFVIRICPHLQPSPPPLCRLGVGVRDSGRARGFDSWRWEGRGS